MAKHTHAHTEQIETAFQVYLMMPISTATSALLSTIAMSAFLNDIHFLLFSLTVKIIIFFCFSLISKGRKRRKGQVLNAQHYSFWFCCMICFRKFFERYATQRCYSISLKAQLEEIYLSTFFSCSESVHLSFADDFICVS